jgi:hypothetical protein
VGNYNIGFTLILKEHEQTSDWIGNYFVICDCVVESCYGCFSGLCVVGGKCRKLGETIVYSWCG